MAIQPDVDIIIAGAGLVGAALACALANSSEHPALNILLVEPGAPPQQFHSEEFDPRVVALTRQSQQLLASVGAWDAIAAARLCAYQRMFVWDGEGTAHIEFNSDELQQPNLGHIVENSVVLHALLNCIARAPNITLLQGRSIAALTQNDFNSEQQSTQVTLDNGEVISTSLLIAADGAHSPIRQQLSIPTREWDYGHHAIVTTVRCEQPHEYTAWQRFSHTGPLAFLPLATQEDDAHFCSIVWSCEAELAEELMASADDVFAAKLGAAFEHRLGNIEHIAKRFSFPLRQRHAQDYIRPGVALIGDAAHTIHPLAGQGVNLGLQDVAVLVEEIHRAQQRGLPLSDYSILKRYQRQRKPANLAMMAAMEGFKQLFGNRHPVALVLRNMGMRSVNSAGVLKNMLAKRAMGLI